MHILTPQGGKVALQKETDTQVGRARPQQKGKLVCRESTLLTNSGCTAEQAPQCSECHAMPSTLRERTGAPVA